MKLNEDDRKNIEVLEIVSTSENALFCLLSQYFAYRKNFPGRQDISSDEALKKTIRGAIERNNQPELIDRKVLDATQQR